MKEKILEYTAIGVVIFWIIAFFWILSASSNCRESGAMWEMQGICL
jgi:hypothetical protein